MALIDYDTLNDLCAALLSARDNTQELTLSLRDLDVLLRLVTSALAEHSPVEALEED